jgi:hypothetical protein
MSGRPYRGDGDEAGQHAVAHGDEVPHVVQHVVEQHGGHAAARQGLTLVRVRAQLEQLQDVFMSRVGS